MIIKYSEEDLPALNFNYIVQMENHKHVVNIFDCENHGFWIEKRLAFVCANDPKACFIHGYYYNHITKKMTAKKLVKYLNESESRYYRLLNRKELAWFNNWKLEQRA